MSLISKELNHDLTDGNYTSEAIQANGHNLIASVLFSNLSNDSATIELEQSVDGENWGTVPDSTKSLNAGQPSHSWNVIGLVRGAFLRINLKPATCTGTLLTLKVLSNE
ncbi:MAG: hypothetical protein PHG67_06235 [Bacteroidales bacterium]|jgi:hypothetical protein|nr:hypothetical protein [Bacteroidales bacterium]